MRMIDADALAEAMGVKRLMIQSWEADSAWGVPIVDAEPVVRCKDCIYYKDAEANIITEHDRVCTYALNHHFYRKPDEYCSKGERREEEHDEAN